MFNQEVEILRFQIQSTHKKMFRQGLRTFATTALRSAEASTAYNTKVSQAQGVVNGLTEGTISAPSFQFIAE